MGVRLTEEAGKVTAAELKIHEIAGASNRLLDQLASMIL
jgi:hypothetical protein